MKLYLLRHGAAEERVSGASDYDRRLTDEGIREMERVALGIRYLVDGLDVILSSPLPRAHETARITAAVYENGTSALAVHDGLASGHLNANSLKELLRSYSPQKRIMLVGHEPDLSDVIRYLTGATIEMKKAGLAFVDAYSVDQGGGVLRWLLTPTQLSVINQHE